MATAKGKKVKTAKLAAATPEQRKYVNSWRQKIPIYERLYETSSAKMLERVKSGQARNTAEVREWMEAYHVLGELNQLPPTAGNAPPAYLFGNRRESKAGVISEEIVSAHTRVRKIDGEIYMKQLRRRIRAWERRYEVSSAEMLELISCGKEEDTVEVLIWMGDYHSLRSMEGFPRKITESSEVPPAADPARL